MVTTRISGLVPGVEAEFALGLLAAEDAIAKHVNHHPPWYIYRIKSWCVPSVREWCLFAVD